MANDMGHAARDQNAALDRITAKGDSDILRVKMANAQAAALMK